MMHSEIVPKGHVNFPAYTGTRVMMMPFHIHNPFGSLPDTLEHYKGVVTAMCAMSRVVYGTGYLTVDEAFVRAGETHRRPGLHIDGAGSWGGGGSWGSGGMLVAASVAGSRAWHRQLMGEPGPEGDCSHLWAQLKDDESIILGPGEVFWCSPTCVHEAIPMVVDVERQFIRLSMPNDAPWYEGYTENPLGIKPTGPVLPARAEFMGYRPFGDRP